jgi:hypothetical protein
MLFDCNVLADLGWQSALCIHRFLCLLKVLLKITYWMKFECNVLADLLYKIAFCIQRFLLFC